MLYQSMPLGEPNTHIWACIPPGTPTPPGNPTEYLNLNLNLHHLYSTPLKPCEGFQVHLTLREGMK